MRRVAEMRMMTTMILLSGCEEYFCFDEVVSSVGCTADRSKKFADHSEYKKQRSQLLWSYNHVLYKQF